MGGTSIEGIRPCDAPVLLLVRVDRADQDECPDTLLGPEGTGNRSFETDARTPCALGRFGRGLVRGCTARHAGVSTAVDQDSRP